jgi:hypothetical protein
LRTNTDEWGGYSKPNWASLQKSVDGSFKESLDFDCMLDTREDESLCKLIGIDLDKKLQEII